MKMVFVRYSSLDIDCFIIFFIRVINLYYIYSFLDLFLLNPSDSSALLNLEITHFLYE